VWLPSFGPATPKVFKMVGSGELEKTKPVLAALPRLVQATNKFGESSLRFAGKEGHEAIVRLLLEKKADSNAAAGSFSGAAPLHYVLPCSQNLRVAELLIASNANINAQMRVGGTPCVRAVYRGNKPLIELLLAC